MTTLTLPSGREYQYNNKYIIDKLENQASEINDLESVLFIQERINNTEDGFARLERILTHTKNSNSTQLGAIGESQVKNELTQMNVPWKDTSKTPHCADIEIEILETKVLIDVKNYKSQVPTEEIDKLYYDCDYNNVKFAIMLSLRSSISKQKSLSVDTRGDKTMVMVQVEHEQDLKTAMNMIEILISNEQNVTSHKLNKQNIENSIDMMSEKMNEIITLKTKCMELSEFINKWNRDVMNSINNYHNDVNEILLDLKSECVQPSSKEVYTDRQVLLDTFKWKNWHHVLNDLWDNSYSVKANPNTKGITEIDVFTNEENIANLSFKKSKIEVSFAKEYKTVRCVENATDWTQLFITMF